jgi:adenylate kinase family enzyme
MEQRVVAEIVGPAGAGKSTLSRALRERDGGIRA